MSHPLFPEIPYLFWRDTLATVHRFAQLVGKVRLAASPRRNHWWNVPFHLTGRGITTRPMGWDPIFAIDFDFLDHRLDIATVDGARHSFALPGLSVAEFTARLTHGLAAVGVDVTIKRPHPFDLSDAHRPFAEDTEHDTYDTAAVTREAYSREVISFGFWFGDDTFSEPAFYSYTAPEPDGLADQPLQPETATWVERNGSHLATLRYDHIRSLPDPYSTVLDFYESAYQAGARRAGWDRARYATRASATDPYA